MMALRRDGVDVECHGSSCPSSPVALRDRAAVHGWMGEIGGVVLPEGKGAAESGDALPLSAHAALSSSDARPQLVGIVNALLTVKISVCSSSPSYRPLSTESFQSPEIEKSSSAAEKLYPACRY
jgi:hypothetical protein